MGRVERNYEDFWICGRCHKEVFYQEASEEVCPYCDYMHGTRDRFDVPDEVKIPLA